MTSSKTKAKKKKNHLNLVSWPSLHLYSSCWQNVWVTLCLVPTFAAPKKLMLGSFYCFAFHSSVSCRLLSYIRKYHILWPFLFSFKICLCSVHGYFMSSPLPLNSSCTLLVGNKGPFQSIFIVSLGPTLTQGFKMFLNDSNTFFVICNYSFLYQWCHLVIFLF
jgi:hypothetical protein